VEVKLLQSLEYFNFHVGDMALMFFGLRSNRATAARLEGIVFVLVIFKSLLLLINQAYQCPL
jgi:hypothetical protein